MILDLLIKTVIVLNNYVFGSQHELCNTDDFDLF